MTSDHVSVNRGALPLVDRLKRHAAALRVAVSQGGAGETLIDAGARTPGSIEAGRIIAEICLGGLGTVRLDAGTGLPNHPFGVTVATSRPVLACLASQYAGWQLTHLSLIHI